MLIYASSTVDAGCVQSESSVPVTVDVDDDDPFLSWETRKGRLDAVATLGSAATARGAFLSMSFSAQL